MLSLKKDVPCFPFKICAYKKQLHIRMLSIRKPKWFVCRFHYWGATLLRVSSIFNKYEFLIHTICGNQSCLTNGVFLSTNSSGKKKLGPTWGEKAGNRCQSVGKKDKRRREGRRNLSIDLTPIRRLPGMRLTNTYFKDFFQFYRMGKHYSHDNVFLPLQDETDN